jgi:hypothetical protein
MSQSKPRPAKGGVLQWGPALLALCAAAGAGAQTSVYDLPEKLVDGNGVDLASGRLTVSFPVVNFGDQVRLKADYFARYPEPGTQNGVPNPASGFDLYSRFSMGTGAEEIETGWDPLGPYAFYRLSTWETVMPNGRAYSKPAGGRFLTQIHSASWQTPGHHPIGMADEEGNFHEYGAWVGNLLVERVLFANGEIWTIKRQKTAWGARLRNVVSNRGYMIQWEYEREVAATAQSQNASWQRIVKISGGSLAHVYCDTSGVAVCPGLSAAGNSATISYFANGYEMTHSSGFKKRIEDPGNFQFMVSSPGTNDQLKAAFGYTACDPTGVVGSVTKNAKTWTYAWEQCTEEERGMSWLMTRTDPQGSTIKVRQLSSYSIPVSYTDELDREFGLGGSPEVGYAGFSYPEGNMVGRLHSSRNAPAGNYLSGKNSGYLATGATYDAVCANLITCNRANTTKDAKGNVTTYSYDPVHGGMLTKTAPAVNGISAQTRYEYVQRHAWLKNSSGGYSPSTGAIWLLARERHCRTTAASGSSCTGGAVDEVITDYDYGPDSGPQNLLVRGIAVTADGQTLRTCFTYDQMGRKISETKPRAGLASCS